MRQHLTPVLVLAALGGIALFSTVAALALLGLVAVASIGRRAFSKPSVNGARVDRFDIPRMERALASGRREAGDTQGQGLDPVRLATPFGTLTATVHWAGQVPLVTVQQPLGVEVELAFVIQRRSSPAALEPVVANTRVRGMVGETRLRAMSLGPSADRLYEAATSRPRLFGEFVDEGLGHELADLADGSHLRLEELSFGGTHLTMVIQPAVDPSEGPWFHATAELSQALTLMVTRLLSQAVIPSAHEL